jgi:hypothetical protein
MPTSSAGQMCMGDLARRHLPQATRCNRRSNLLSHSTYMPLLLVHKPWYRLKPSPACYAPAGCPGIEQERATRPRRHCPEGFTPVSRAEPYLKGMYL